MAAQRRRDGPELEHVDAFNKRLSVLTGDLAGRYPNDAEISRAMSRVQTAIRFDPLGVIQVTGPYLYKYRTQIYALEDGGGHEFFMSKDYESELGEGVDPKKVDASQRIIPAIKACVRKMGPEERSGYEQEVVYLLDSYVEYLSAVRLPS